MPPDPDPTPEEVQRLFEQLFREALGSGVLRLDEFDRLFDEVAEPKWQRPAETPNIDRIHVGNKLLVRTAQKLIIETNRDGQLGRLRSQIRALVAELKSQVPTGTSCDLHFEFPPPAQIEPFQTAVRFLVRGIVRPSA